MKRVVYFLLCSALFVALFAVLTSSCSSPMPYMKMNPPADSDKPLPVPANDHSCWMHSAANMLAGAGYGNGTTVQSRADDIFAVMAAHYGTVIYGWIDTALQWWLGSSNNIWTSNPYNLVTVIGNKVPIPWANAYGARTLANELRSCNLVGVSISWPTGNGGTGGHSITSWGDSSTIITALTTNPGGVRVADSDTDNGGDIQAYMYDAFTNPNPGGPNEGNGWYFNYSIPHPFIKHICTLSPTNGYPDPSSMRVMGSYQIHQVNIEKASDLHYQVSTDVDILTYRTWLDWEGIPNITESQPRRELTVVWDLSQNMVPQCTWLTINTEFVLPSWNSISYQDVYFTYPKGKAIKFPGLSWKMDTPVLERAETISNVSGGYVIGSFDLFDPNNPNEPPVRYRLIHQYAYNQSPEFHTFTLTGTPGFTVANLLFGHSYGCPTIEELWKFENWMTEVGEKYSTSEKAVVISIDWKGQLPYPQGDGGTN